MLLSYNDYYFFPPVIPKDFDPSFCLTDVYICKSAKFCVARKHACDGVLHCDDGSDEIDCVIVSNFKQLGICLVHLTFSC